MAQFSCVLISSLALYIISVINDGYIDRKTITLDKLTIDTIDNVKFKMAMWQVIQEMNAKSEEVERYWEAQDVAERGEVKAQKEYDDACRRYKELVVLEAGSSQSSFESGRREDERVKLE